MSRIYEYHESTYHGGDSKSPMDEYLERINRMPQTPSVIEDYSDAPHAHKYHNNNPAYPENHNDQRLKIFHPNHHHHEPKMHKKVHFSEHDKRFQIDQDREHEVYEEKTIDVEADGFIKQNHKNFESRNTFNVY